MATGELMKKHPDKLRAILAGRREGVKFIYEHTDEAIKNSQPDLCAAAARRTSAPWSELVDAKFWTEGRIEMPLLANTVQAMNDVGMLDKESIWPR